MSTKPIELEDLAGEHELSGVEFGEGPRHPHDDHVPNSITFVLGDKAYRVTEDPDDGYRSSVREIVEVPVTHVCNRFPPIHVTATHLTKHIREGGREEACSILELREGKELILEVGTENSDDYYPCYVAHFYPDRMSSNDARRVYIASARLTNTRGRE